MHESDPTPSATAASAERLVKLALVIGERGPLSFADIRAALPFEYPGGEGGDATQARRREQSSRRRFERDKQALRGYGICVQADGEGRYTLDDTASVAAEVELDAAERSLVRCLCTALLGDASYPFKTELRTVLGKLGDELELPDMLPERTPDHDDVPRALSAVQRALYEHKRLKFSYTDTAGERSTREVEPFGFFLHGRHGYVVAHEPQSGAQRTFRIDRMRRASVKEGTRFEPLPFDVGRYCGLPFQFGPDHFTATIRFEATRRPRAEEVAAHRGELSVDETSGQASWRVGAADAEALARWCVHEGPGIVPIEPPEALRAYRTGLQEALRATRGAP